MEYVSAVLQQETMEQGKQNAGKEQVVRMNGTVHAIRNMGELCFVILRRREGLLQCVCSKQMARELKEEMAVTVQGTVTEESRAPGGIEMHLTEVTVLSRPAEPLPLSRRAAPLWRVA